MSQILNSLVVSEDMSIQRALEDIMNNNIEGYVLTFTTYPAHELNQVDREPDIIFIAGADSLTSPGIIHVRESFPRKTYVALTEATEEERREYLALGLDEVMSLAELRSDIGRRLLEKLLAIRDLAAAEVRIEQSEERFRGIIEHSHDVILLLDDAATVVYTSPAFGRLLGYESWEVLGQTFFDLVHEEDRPTVEVDVRRMMSVWVDDGMSMEYRFRRKDGAWRYFETIATNLLKTDPVRAVVLNSRDITQQKLTEGELDKHRRHLEDLVVQRTRELAAALESERELTEQQRTFISMVSHEFRTPLTIIDGNAQIIERRGETIEKEVLHQRAGTIRRAVERLVHLIETILSAHAIESGKLSANPSPCSLEKIIRETCSDQQDISPGREIGACIEGLPEVMMLDEKLVRHMMINLLSNAIKYSPGGGPVEVEARLDGGEAVVSVRDHGVGIPENEVSKLFQKYFRASTSGGIPGSGLGLNLVRQFVELHNGSISLHSRVGEGTTVTVRLPVKN